MTDWKTKTIMLPAGPYSGGSQHAKAWKHIKTNGQPVYSGLATLFLLYQESSKTISFCSKLSTWSKNQNCNTLQQAVQSLTVMSFSASCAHFNWQTNFRSNTTTYWRNWMHSLELININEFNVKSDMAKDFRVDDEKRTLFHINDIWSAALY